MDFSPSEFDPFRLSAELERAAQSLAIFKRNLASRRAQAHPFGAREFPGLSTYRQVSRLHPSDPLRQHLLRYVVRLTDERIHIPWSVHDAELEMDETHVVGEHREECLSISEIRRRALTGKDAERDSWWASLDSAEARLSAHRIGRLVRSTEVSSRMGVDASVLWNPLRAPASTDASDVPSGLRLVDFAERLLRETQEQANYLFLPGFGPLMEGAVARDASDGWPARLAPDSLRQMLEAKELFRGVVIEPGELPARLFPMSFPRASAQVGAALSRALAPRDLPAVVAWDVEDLRGHYCGQLFFLWTMSAPFMKRTLGLSPLRIERQMRGLGRALLVHLRISAARLILLEHSHEGSDALRTRFCELASALTNQELPSSSALARFRVRLDERARFAGLLAAFATFEDLCETYNDDWFKNPRAQEDLRARLSLPPAIFVATEEVERGLQLTARWLGGWS